MLNVLLVGAGGFLGSIARYGIGEWIKVEPGTGFPYATLLINATGCFAIGLFMAFAAENASLPPAYRLFIAAGFLGGYTTFSAFGYETVKLIEAGNMWFAAANAFGSVAIGLTAVYLGTITARLF